MGWKKYLQESEDAFMIIDVLLIHLLSVNVNKWVTI